MHVRSAKSIGRRSIRPDRLHKLFTSGSTSVCPFAMPVGSPLPSLVRSGRQHFTRATLSCANRIGRPSRRETGPWKEKGVGLSPSNALRLRFGDMNRGRGMNNEGRALPPGLSIGALSATVGEYNWSWGACLDSETGAAH